MQRCIIIGSTRCGTTSMYNYLGSHPQINKAKGGGFMETHFFDYHHLYQKGIKWYESQFGDNDISIDTSPTMLQHALAPLRVKEHYPDAKFIVLLRNPIDRAYSDYWLARKKGWASNIVSFERHIKEERYHIDKEQLNQHFFYNLFYLSYTHLLGFVERGKYSKHLKVWLDTFPRRQFIILKSEIFFDNPQKTVNDVFDFLGVKHKTINARKWHKGKYPEMKKRTREQLELFYESHNERLSDALGRDFIW